MVLTGVRTCSPFEEGILHAWSGVCAQGGGRGGHHGRSNTSYCPQPRKWRVKNDKN